MDKPDQLEYRQQLMDLMRSYRKAQILITCAELGVFEALGREAAGVKILARHLKVNPEALARLLNAAVALGLLEKEGQAYRVSFPAAECLAYESPYFLGNLVKQEGSFYRRWSALSHAIHSGHRPHENTRDERGPNWVRNFELALYDAARTTAPLVAEVLEPYLPSKPLIRVIDIGGGHGAYSLSLAQRYPDLEAVVFELPPVAEVAADIIKEAKLEDRVSARAGDFRTDELGNDYDLALLFGVLVSETPETARELLGKIYASLAPGGWLVIRGQYLNPDRTGPLEATISDLHMLLSTESGAAHTQAEIYDWLKESGFALPQTLQLPAPERAELILVQKPAE